MRPVSAFKLVVVAALSLAAVGTVMMPGLSQRRAGAAGRGLVAIEGACAGPRAAHDAIELARSRGSEHSLEGEPLRRMADRYTAARARLAARLASAPPRQPDADDDRALQVMRRALERDLPPEAPAAAEDGSQA